MTRREPRENMRRTGQMPAAKECSSRGGGWGYGVCQRTMGGVVPPSTCVGTRAYGMGSSDHIEGAWRPAWQAWLLFARSVGEQ